MFPVNQVFQDNKRRMRLIWRSGNSAFWIDIDDPKAWPEAVCSTDLKRMLIDRLIEPIEDPYLEYQLRDVGPDSTDWGKRETAWATIKDHIAKVELFYRTERGQIVQQIMKEHGVTHQTANRLIRRYWQRGMNKNTMLPDYHRSGAAGQKRTPKKAKLGRPRTVRSGKGCIVDAAIEKIFRQAIESRLLKRKPSSVADAHASSLSVIRSAWPKKKAHELPTVEQFRYFYQREYEKVEVLKKQRSAIDFASNIRPLISTSTAETQGPGYRYQIDATIADLYLLSEHDRTRIVGRPVIYLVFDVFSRMVVGVHVGFEGPSWTSAMLALANTIDNKVEYCAKYAIEINESDWPVEGLPGRILADKGELNGTRVESFCTAFGTTIENATARRGDAKGIVERHFRTIQDDFKPYVEGVVTPITSRKRGGEDNRQDSTLNLHEFTRIIIASVLYHNNFQVLSKYDRCEGMPPDVPAIPTELWSWGTANLTGKLRTAPINVVRINLMPHTDATVSELGIRVFDSFYTCPEAVKQGWFHRARTNRPQRVSVAYDPQSANHIYLRPTTNLNEYWVCDISDRSRRFRGMSFWDVWTITRAEKKADANASLEQVVAKGQLLEKIESINKSAKQEKPAPGPRSVKDLGMQVRRNKQEEKVAERARNAFKPDRPKRSGSAEVVPIRKEERADHSFPDMSDLLFTEDDDDSV